MEWLDSELRSPADAAMSQAKKVNFPVSDDVMALLFSERGFSSMKAAVLFIDADAGDVEETAPFTQAKGLR